MPCHIGSFAEGEGFGKFLLHFREGFIGFEARVVQAGYYPAALSF
jgi:hypothetical protein